MFQEIVQYGRFRLLLRAFTPRPISYLTDFLGHLPHNVHVVNTPSSDASLTLIMSESLNVSAPDEKFWAKLVEAWKTLENNWKGASLLSLASKMDSGNPVEFVYLIPREQQFEEVRARLGIYVVRTKERWLIRQGWLPLHAAAVEHHQRGYLFLGESGAGKTTVTRLSREVADSILNDERVFVKYINGGYFLMAATNFSHLSLNFSNEGDATSTNSSEQMPVMKSDHIVPLSGIFLLRKEMSDYILPSSKLSTAHAIMKGFLESAIDIISSPKELENAFHFWGRMAEQISGYELHFRKSSDFWKLIDERFAD